jgi:hypothetical protein
MNDMATYIMRDALRLYAGGTVTWVTPRVLRATCPCCKARVTAQAPADMPEGSPFGPGIKAVVAYLHGCQMVGFKRLTELCEGLFGLTISQGAISNMLARASRLAPSPEPWYGSWIATPLPS